LFCRHGVAVVTMFVHRREASWHNVYWIINSTEVDRAFAPHHSTPPPGGWVTLIHHHKISFRTCSVKMPKYKCGCGQNFTRRAMQYHLRGRTTPRLVTAIVKSYQTFGPTTSPPRLNPAKKLRSSRRYLPSSPTLASDDGHDVAMSEGGIIEGNGATGSGALHETSVVIDEAGTEHAINAARAEIWSGFHHDDEDADDDMEEYGEHGDEGMDAVDEDVQDGYEDNVWDDHEIGLSALDSLGEDFERDSVANGEFYVIPSIIQAVNFSDVAGKLSERDMSILRAYAFKVGEHLTDESFAKIPYAFPKEPVPTVKVCKSRLQAISGFKPVRYDCCINSCCCFAGEHKDHTKCPYCDEDRHVIDRDGRKKPRKIFNYLPLIPRLVSMFANPTKAKEMQYRAFEHEHTAGKISDIFDSYIYRRLLGKRVAINGSHALHKYFSDPRDIALGLSTDGFCPFKRRKATAWPLILFNYNLPPEIRFHGDNRIDLGTIPGPNKPKDFDSYAWPVFEEFMRLQHGVKAFDTLADEFFLLRAYLLLIFGDIPAMSMVMRMTGHNGFSPCRMCKILGVRTPNSENNTYYVPLDRSFHPTVTESDSAIAVYNPADLPLRTEAEILRQAKEVRDASSKTQKGRLSKAYGIKGLSVFSNLKSLCFPLSFPYDFMHLIWENLIPNLILLWTGGFKGIDEGAGEYQFSSNVWEAIGEATAAAGSTIPSVFGVRPPNPAKNKSSYSAEAWSFWALYIGPILLRRRFRNQRYYKHFIELVKLLQICLQFEITTEEIQTIRDGFINWVEDYEK
jgi:hypothetical protein